ncbi:hypothetical protein V6N13_007709 [Hibiscus sabdariffa]
MMAVVIKFMELLPQMMEMSLVYIAVTTGRICIQDGSMMQIQGSGITWMVQVVMALVSGNTNVKTGDPYLQQTSQSVAQTMTTVESNSMESVTNWSEVSQVNGGYPELITKGERVVLQRKKKGDGKFGV